MKLKIPAVYSSIFIIIIISTLMALSSSNWLFLWMSLEINILRFIPILIYSKNYQEIEAAIKYFLAQAMGSALILISRTLIWVSENILYKLLLTILILSILLKVGSVPCHFWYISVISSVTWTICLILTSWQKLAPLSILSFLLIINRRNFIILIAALNALLGGLIGMNQNQLQSIIAYSSINHIGWIISLIYINKPIATIIYFAIYVALITPAFILFYRYNTKNIKILNKLISISPLTLILIAILIFSISGIPPLTGFIPKLMTIFILGEINKLLIIILIIGSLMRFYFYLNIIINIIINNKFNLNLKLIIKKKVLIYLLFTSRCVFLTLAPYTIIYALTLFY